uniref:hypothetical protein n=1 Tax=Variovorax sp. dw_308 TaxID=2721546 RepID=UPI001C44C8A6
AVDELLSIYYPSLKLSEGHALWLTQTLSTNKRVILHFMNFKTKDGHGDYQPIKAQIMNEITELLAKIRFQLNGNPSDKELRHLRQELFICQEFMKAIED